MGCIDTSKIEKYTLENPWIKSIVFFFSVIISGVLCSAFVAEITIEGIIVWTICYKKLSFWLIILYMILVVIYNIFIYRQENNIKNFMDIEYCKAYIIKACMPDLIEQYKKDIRSGKGNQGVSDLMVQLKKMKK